LTAILGNTFTETNDIAGSFSYFFDVVADTKTKEDVGVAGTPLTQADIRTWQQRTWIRSLPTSQRLLR
jgi:hypothetical protein